MRIPLEGAAFAAYRQQLAKREPLSAEVERELALRCLKGDRQASGRLVEACLPFVVRIAMEYRRWGVPLEDIVQEGNIGLLKAVQRFDPDRGCRLVTYAAYWIRAEIREFVARGYRIVRLGSSKGERRALRAYRKTNERDAATLAEVSGLSEERVTALLPLLGARDVSLEASSDGGPSALDKLAADVLSPETAACDADEQAFLHRAITAAVGGLDARERRIIRQRWLSEEPKTLEQLGETFGVSKERVRQIEARAKKQIKAHLEEIVGDAFALSA